MEPRESRCVQGYGFLFFAKTLGSKVDITVGRKLGDKLVKQGQEATNFAAK